MFTGSLHRCPFDALGEPMERARGPQTSRGIRRIEDRERVIPVHAVSLA
jgi:hypothetical protein